MAVTPTYQLTVDLAGVTGQDLPGISVEIAPASSRPVYPVGSEIIFPQPQSRTTDDNGVATFDLLPSSRVGNYIFRLGSYRREFTMPERDANFGDLVSSGMMDSDGPITPTVLVHVWSQPTRDVPTAIPADAASGFPVVTVEAPDADGYVVFAQPASASEINHVEKNGVEQFGTFEKGAATFDVNGIPFEYWITEGDVLFPQTIAGIYTFRRES